MSAKTRQNTPKGSYFLTIRLADPSSDLLLRHIETLRHAMRYTLRHHPMQIDAMAVLPNIIHALWTLPDGDRDYPNRVGMLKARFSRAMDVPKHRTPTQIQRNEKGIWQRRYWHHHIRDAADFDHHCDLIHLSPVHAGLCANAQDWPFSSIHRARANKIQHPMSHHNQAATPHYIPQHSGPLASVNLLI